MTARDKCTELESRIRRLETSAAPFWAWPVICALVLIVTSLLLHFQDVKMQVQSQHPDWSIKQVRDEAKHRIGQEWNEFSIFTSRPFADQ